MILLEQQRSSLKFGKPVFMPERFYTGIFSLLIHELHFFDL